MEMRLEKTLLSQKISPQSVLVGLVSYLCLLIIFFIDDDNLRANGQLVYEQGHYWKAFTSQLMHGDFVHLGHNTLFFTIFSILLNHYFGFWVFPVLSLIAGGLINLIALKIYDPQVYLVGISGVIYFMAAFWMTLFVGIERKKSIFHRLMTVTGISLILFFPEVFEKNVSYLAHGLGYGMGVLFGVMYFFMNKSNLRKYEKWIEKTPDPELEDFMFPDGPEKEIRQPELPCCDSL